MRVTIVTMLPLLATLVAGSAVGAERFRLVPTERPTPRSCIEVERRREAKVVAFYDEHGTIVKEITLELPCNYPVVSRNKQNVVIREPVGDCDIYVKYRLSLYDQLGQLIAASEPLSLYDRYANPLGDGKTVLVVTEAVDQPFFGIAVLQGQGGELREIRHLGYAGSGPALDVAMDGSCFTMMAGPQEGEKTAQAILLRPDGTVAWSTALDEGLTGPGLAISPRLNFIVAPSKDSITHQRFANLLDVDGRRIAKIAIGGVGVPKVAFTHDASERFAAICHGNEILVLDTVDGRTILSHIDSDLGVAFWDCAILANRTALVGMTVGLPSVNHPTVATYLAVLDPEGLYRKLKAPFDGTPRVQSIGTGNYLEITSPKGVRWVEIMEGGL
ncbi:hypothetical protein JXA88_03455 [Candidatus Fermentibacteria bacterium]|nr:hypothetical protein [Candidatus Fermentibacteria bacterium]